MGVGDDSALEPGGSTMAVERAEALWRTYVSTHIKSTVFFQVGQTAHFDFVSRMHSGMMLNAAALGDASCVALRSSP